MAMRSSVSSTCGFSAASIAASDRLPWSSSSSSSGSGAGGASSSSSSSASSLVVLVVVGRGGGRRRGGAARRLAGAAVRRAGAGAAAGAGLSAGEHAVDLVGLHLAREGGLEVDHVAQHDRLVEQLVAPDGDRLEGQRALAEAGDHRVAAGLDALGDGDLALARQELDRAHLAQVHPDRIVGAVERLAADARHRELARAAVLGGRRGVVAAAVLVLGLVVVDDVDAHLGEHRHHVLDLLGGDLVGGQDLVQLVVGDVAARLGGRDHLLDRRLAHVEHRAGAVLGVLGFLRLGVFCGHGLTPSWSGRGGGPAGLAVVSLTNR